jgi:hypothetical protein
VDNVLRTCSKLVRSQWITVWTTKLRQAWRPA